ncbi:hypothetical protein myaer87_23450 [Microcystis aeruginosa NIES-87]|nr:hypothetical protein myaer87_23450 [Microcystis aeruginosa NIES-87]
MTLNDVFGGTIVSLIVLLILPFFTRRKLFILASISLFIVTVAIFTNLHFVHNYYPYANALFLLVAAGFALVGLIEKNRRILHYIGWLTLTLVLLCQFHLYRDYWYPQINHRNELEINYLEIAERVKNRTSTNGVILIYGSDWNPLIPYYSQRRALMFNGQSNNQREENALDQLSKANYKIEGIIFCNETRYEREQKKDLNSLYNLKDKPIFSNKRCDVYTTRHSK